MGRPRRSQLPAPDTGIDIEQMEKDQAASDQLAKIEHGITAEQLRFSEQRGLFRGSHMTRKFLDLIQIKLLAEWRDSKNYKGLRYLDAQGKPVTIQNFSDLCLSIGLSYETANEWISNYQVLGEDFLREADAAGIGVRDLRRLRKLPPNEIEAAKELLATDGKEGVIEFVEDLCARQAKEKQSLEKKIKSLADAAETHDQQLLAKDKKINEIDRKLKERDRSTDWHDRAREIAVETTTVNARILEACDRLHTLRDAILTEDFGAEREAAIEAMAVVFWDGVHQSLLEINDLARACSENFLGYKEKARPLLDMLDVFGPYPVNPDPKK